MSNKLELTWYNKYKKQEIEPRILIENQIMSNRKNEECTSNILIHGDNLLALKALENNYTGRIKFIYIDQRTPIMIQKLNLLFARKSLFIAKK